MITGNINNRREELTSDRFHIYNKNNNNNNINTDYVINRHSNLANIMTHNNTNIMTHNNTNIMTHNNTNIMAHNNKNNININSITN